MICAIQKLVFFVWVLVLLTPVFSQKSGENYFLRHSMIFFSGEIPRVSPTDLVFTTQSICGFASSPYDSRILRRGDQVQILSVNKVTKPASIVFSYEEREFKIELANTSPRVLGRSFKLAFSRKRTEFGLGESVKTWSGVIKNYGYPAAKCHSDGGWFYFLEFSPACGSFDGCVLNFDKGKLTMYGYI